LNEFPQLREVSAISFDFYTRSPSTGPIVVASAGSWPGGRTNGVQWANDLAFSICLCNKQEISRGLALLERAVLVEARAERRGPTSEAPHLHPEGAPLARDAVDHLDVGQVAEGEAA
jgi:hypothetical protein